MYNRTVDTVLASLLALRKCPNTIRYQGGFVSVELRPIAVRLIGVGEGHRV